MQDQELVTIQFASPEDIEGYLPYATFVTAQDLFGDDVSSVADETRAKIPAWAQVVSESGGGALSPEVLETRFRIQHDLIFKDNTSIVEIVPFSGGGVIGGAFWTLLPFSLGNVHLNTSSAADYPTIAPNFLAVDFDIQVLTAAGRLVRKHFGTAPLSDWVTDQTGLGTPATNATDSEWKDYILGSGKLRHRPLWCFILCVHH